MALPVKQDIDRITRQFAERLTDVVADLKDQIADAVNAAITGAVAFGKQQQLLELVEAAGGAAADAGKVVKKGRARKAKPRKVNGSRTKWGTTPKITRAALLSVNPTIGLTPNQIHSWAEQSGQKVKTASIRIALNRMKETGDATRRRGKWYATDKLRTADLKEETREDSR